MPRPRASFVVNAGAMERKRARWTVERGLPSSERPIDSTSSSRPGADAATLIALAGDPELGVTWVAQPIAKHGIEATMQHVAVETHGQRAVTWLDDEGAAKERRGELGSGGPDRNGAGGGEQRVDRAARPAGGCRGHGGRHGDDGDGQRRRQQAQPAHERVPVENATVDARLDPCTARGNRHRRVARLRRDTRVEVGLQPLQLVRVEVEAKRHDLRLAETEPACQPREDPCPVGFVERLRDARSCAEERTGHGHRDLAGGVADAEHDRA